MEVSLLHRAASWSDYQSNSLGTTFTKENMIMPFDNVHVVDQIRKSWNEICGLWRKAKTPFSCAEFAHLPVGE